MYLLGTKVKALHIKISIPSTLAFVYCEPKFSVCGVNSDLIYMYVWLWSVYRGCKFIYTCGNLQLELSTCQMDAWLAYSTLDLTAFHQTFFLSCERFAFTLDYAGSCLSANAFWHLAFISYHQCLCSHTMLSSKLTFSHDHTWSAWKGWKTSVPTSVGLVSSFFYIIWGSIRRISHFRDQIWVSKMSTSHVFGE